MRTNDLVSAAGAFAVGIVFVVAIAMSACSSAGMAPPTATPPNVLHSPQGVAETSSAPVSTPAPVIRPPSVPTAASLVTGALEVGNILYAVRCAGDVLVVSTTRETLYAELPCSKVLPDEVFRQYLSQPVLIRVYDGEPRQLHLASGAVGSLGFQVGNVWVLTR